MLTYLLLLSQEDAQEESGWKQVHGDVFRPPRKGMLLSVFLGQGTQIFIMTFITLCKDCFTRAFDKCYPSLSSYYECLIGWTSRSSRYVAVALFSLTHTHTHTCYVTFYFKVKAHLWEPLPLIQLHNQPRPEHFQVSFSFLKFTE